MRVEAHSTPQPPRRRDTLAVSSMRKVSSAVDLATPVLAQEHDWDCGLACAQMALRALGQPPDAVHHTALRAKLDSDDIWTIDILFLLNAFGVHADYFTSSWGCALNHATKPFYASSHSKDFERVRHLFDRAKAEGMSVRIATFSAKELWDTLRHDDHMLLALVDLRYLYTDDHEVAGHFHGHYILLVGIDRELNCFLLRDPARKDGQTVHVSADRVERARLSDGTDQDLILISL